MVFDGDVAAEGAVVGEDDVVTDLAVVGDVGVAEEEVIGADAGGDGLVGAAVDGAVFAEDVAVTDDEVGWFAEVLEVLGFSAYGGEGEELVVRADLRGAGEDDVGVEDAAVTELDVRADDAPRADLDIGAQRGFGRDDRGGMDHAVSLRSAGSESKGKKVVF